jgi:L-asparaginase II
MTEVPILAKVIRGETVESIHRGHIIALDGEGKVHLKLGDPDTVTYFRSASKPFRRCRASPAVRRMNLDTRPRRSRLHAPRIRVKPMHVRVVASMLVKAASRKAINVRPAPAF